MGFSSSMENTHMKKRGRYVDHNGDLYGLNGVDNQLFDAGLECGYKRYCANDRVAEFVGLGSEDQDMLFTCYQPYPCGVLREETADSETCSSMVYYDSENFSPPFCRSSYSDASSVLRFPVPDDAQSSTSDSCCCCCCDTSDDDDDAEEEDDDNEGESSSSSSKSSCNIESTQSFISYLFEASDDDLGLPPPPPMYDNSSNVFHQNQSNVLEKHVQPLDFDVGLDLDLDLDVADDKFLDWDL